MKKGSIINFIRPFFINAKKKGKNVKLNRAIISYAIVILITNVLGIAINIIYGTTENYEQTATA